MNRKLVRAVMIVAALIAATSATQAAWAVAYGDSGNPIVARKMSGYSVKRAALDECAKQAQNCKIVGYDWDGCFAMANTGTKATKWGFGSGYSRPRAHNAAIADCEAVAGAGRCEIAHEFCGD